MRYFRRLFLAIIGLLLCNYGFAAHQEQLDGLTYEYLEYYSGVRYASLVGYYNTNLIPENLTIPATVKFKKYYGYNCHISEIAPGALKGCTKLKSVNTYVVEDIKYNAFENCTSLQKVTLGVSCKKIGSKAFTGCTALDTINYVSGVTIAEDAFDETTYQDAKLIVDDKYRDECNSHAVWSKFKNKIYQYSISVYASYGRVSYNGVTVENAKYTSFVAREGSSITLSFMPEEGRELANLIIDGEDAISKVINNQYTIDNVSKSMEIRVSFFSITITAKGNGHILCKSVPKSMPDVPGAEVGDTRNGTNCYIAPEDEYLNFYIYPDEGYQLSKVIRDGTDITSQVYIYNNRFAEDIKYSTTLDFTFDEIPPVTHTLSIKSIGNGSVSYNGTNIRGVEKAFSVEEGNSAVLSFTPDAGYRIKSVKLNNTDITSNLTNNQYTISTINSDNNLEVEFEPIIHSLTIKVTGFGSATYNNSEIRDKSSSFDVNEGTSAIVVFTPDAGYRIKSVKLNDTNVTANITNGQYVISNISSDNTLEVEFEKAIYTLNIKSTGNGTTTYNSTTIRQQGSSFTVNEGSSAVITFSPDAGHRIKSVVINGADVTAIVTNFQYTISNIVANMNVEVEYEAIPITTYSFTIKVTGNGNATYNGTAIRDNTTSFTVNEGTSATITFTPDAGYRIASVKVNGTDVTSSVVNNSYTISNISANTTLVVTFEAIPPTTYTLSITATGNGSATYNSTAIRGKTSSFTVNEGTSATITFASDAGYRIANVKVNDADVTESIANNSYTISNISANTTLEVAFEAIPPTTYTLSITASGNGSATYNSTAIRGKTQTFIVTEGTTATVTFTPDAGYRIASVKLNGTDVTSSVANNKYTISNITANTTLAVTFEAIPPTTYTFSIIASGNGSATYNSTTIKGGKQTFTVVEGTSVTVTFTPDFGYRIKSVKLNGTDVTSSVANSQYTISNIKSDNILAVEFEVIPVPTYSLSVTSSGNGSAFYNNTTVRNKTEVFTVDEGTSATVKFTPDTGYKIKSVSLNGTDVTTSISNNQYTVSNITANTTLDVAFEAIPITTYSFSIQSTGNGSATYNGTTIRGNTSSFTVSEGTSATVTFTPDAGYRIASVKLNGTDVTSNVVSNKYSISNITANTTLAVTFEAITHTLSITAIGNGSATYNSTAVRGKTQSFTVTEGTSATITFTPDTGYRIKSVKLNNTDVTSSVANSQYTISNINSDNTVTVEFEAIPPTTYSLSITATGNGTATYNSTAIRGKTQTFTVTEGTSATIAFTPDAGYKIKSVKLNNTDVTSSVANSQYTISNIKSDNTLAVEFEAIPPTTYSLSITAIGNGSATYNSTAVRGKTQTFTVTEGTSATITFAPDTGYRIKSVKLNSTDVTSSVANSQYVISDISSNNTLVVEFEAIPPSTYMLNIVAVGNGSVTYNNTTIRNQSKDFTVTEKSAVTITISPDNGYRLASVIVNKVNVTAKVANNQYTISNISGATNIEVKFEAVTHTLDITAKGNGTAVYSGTTIRDDNASFTVAEGASATVRFTPDAGYKIKSVLLNDINVTSDVINNVYTINDINSDNTLEVEFEAIKHTLTIKATGNGSVSYNDNAIRNQSKSYKLSEGASTMISITPDEGYRIQSVKVNGSDQTSEVDNGQFFITNIMQDTNVEVVFEEIPPTTYSLTITATGNGIVTYDGNTIRDNSSAFTVVEGSYATVQITPDDGYRLKQVTLDGKDVTASVVNNQYTTAKILANATLAVEFVEAVTELAVNGVNYRVVSQDGQTVNVASGNYGLTLTVPATFEANGKTWTVVGIDSDALANATELAAIEWQPEAAFTAKVSNPNLLLYVSQSQYAPSDIQNVVVGNQAENIILTEAESGNNFYCPKAFTAKRISYEHNYSMTSGYKTCQGWETLVLPFDVTMMINAKGVELVPRSKWSYGSSLRTFWLYQLTDQGWKAAEGINANIPYILCMPNNEMYDASYNQTGNIQYIGNNVQVMASEGLKTGKYGNKQLVANYQNQTANNGIYALNVSNEWYQNTATEAEGSTFIRSLRNVHPFEAYMTVEGSNARAIPIFVDDNTTNLTPIPSPKGEGRDGWYDLQGRKLQNEPKQKGIYIYKGKKVKK